MEKIEIKYLLVFLFLLVISILFDRQALNLVLDHRIQFLNTFFVFLSHFGTFSIFVIFTLLYLVTKQSKKKILQMWLTVFIAGLVTFILKLIIERPRPVVDSLIGVSGYSFPSGHTLVPFALYIVLADHIPKLKNWWLVIASLIAFSRLYLGVHYISEVVLSIFLGGVIGMYSLKILKHIRLFTT